MSLLSLLLVACNPHDATMEATYAFYMAAENSDMLADLDVRKRRAAQKDLVPVDCRALSDETLRLEGADTACSANEEEAAWFYWLNQHSYYLKQGKVSTDDDIYRVEALINSEGDLQLTFHFNVPDYGEARFGWVIKPDFQPTICSADETGAVSLHDIDGDWLSNWSADDEGYTVWHLNAGSYQLNPSNVDLDKKWNLLPEWQAGAAFGRFGVENIVAVPTKFDDGTNPFYYPMWPEPVGSLGDLADEIRTNLTEGDDLGRMGSAPDFGLDWRVHSNEWRPVDDMQAGLDNWVEVSLGNVRIKNFDLEAVKAGKTSLQGDFQMYLQGTESYSQVLVKGTFDIAKLTEITAYSPTLEEVKMEENKTPTCGSGG